MPARILIVENESETARHLRDILLEFGYLVTGLASSGAAAVARAQNDAPDLALLDVCIPGEMDGAETARALREKFNIPIIFVNANAEPKALLRSEISEPVGYLTKPFKRAQLQANIEIALYKHREDLKCRERVESLLAALRALGAGVLSVNREEAVTLLNPAAEVWTGWASGEALGRSLHKVFPLVAERNGERVYAPVAEVLASGAMEELGNGILLLGGNGAKRAVEGSVGPIRDHRGEISGAVIIFRDRCKRPRHTRPDPERPSVTMVAASPAMQQVVRFARRVAESEINTILLQGESGTGKDVLARFMHDIGSRRDRPFVPLSCAAIPETLLESEMFGYEKGAFTDANSQKPGILEIASGGTVFLDEIGDMPVSLQAKMLRVLEAQTFRRLGGLRDVHVDLRVMVLRKGGAAAAAIPDAGWLSALSGARGRRLGVYSDRATTRVLSQRDPRAGLDSAASARGVRSRTRPDRTEIEDRAGQDRRTATARNGSCRRDEAMPQSSPANSDAPGLVSCSGGDRGTKEKIMKVEILYFSDCPNHAPAVNRVREVLAQEGTSADMIELEVKDAVTAETVGFLGSPSIRIDGQDVEHTARTACGFGLMCRTYMDGGRRAGVPPRELIRAAVREAKERRQQ